jgi:hypothetical protein
LCAGFWETILKESNRVRERDVYNNCASVSQFARRLFCAPSSIQRYALFTILCSVKFISLLSRFKRRRIRIILQEDFEIRKSFRSSC